jgi:hypothetical protein
VQDSVYDKFIDLLIEKVKSTPVGDGFDDAVTNGPVVSDHSPEVRSVMWDGLTKSLLDFKDPFREGMGSHRIRETRRCQNSGRWRETRGQWIFHRSHRCFSKIVAWLEC